MGSDGNLDPRIKRTPFKAAKPSTRSNGSMRASVPPGTGTKYGARNTTGAPSNPLSFPRSTGNFKSDITKMLADPAMKDAYIRQGLNTGTASLAKGAPGYTPPVGLSGGNSGSSGGSGGYGSSGEIPTSSDAVGQPATPSLADLLNSLPKGPTGLTDLQGAYQALMGKYNQGRNETEGSWDEARAAISKMYGETNKQYGEGNTDYVQALQALNSQSQNTSLGTVDKLKSIRGGFMSDMGTAVGARGTEAANELLTRFQELKAEKEAKIIEEYMAQQAELQAAQIEAAFGGGGSGGGGRGYGGGGSSKAPYTKLTESASQEDTVKNPQYLEMLAEMAKTDPQGAAALQMLMDRGQDDPILKNASLSAELSGTNASNKGKRAAVTSALSTVLPVFSRSLGNKAKSKSAAQLAAAKKARDSAATAQRVLEATRGLPGVYGNPSSVLKVKDASTSSQRVTR